MYSLLGLPFDQALYITFLLLGYPLGAVFRYGLSPQYASISTRHVATTCTGIIIGLLCFGLWQMCLLFLMTGICYMMLRLLPSNIVHIYTLVFAMIYLSIGHVYRMITDYESWRTDFSIPLMVLVQRVSMTAFDLHDATQNASEDNGCKRMNPPTLLEYWSYNYNFHTFLAGPVCTIKEYLKFMEGSNETERIKNCHGKHDKDKYPVLGRFLQALCFGALHQMLNAQYPVGTLLKPDYSLPMRILFAHLIMFQIRARYYFGWLLAESVNNFVGLGLRGYDEEGNPVWDVCKYAKVWNIEFGTNFREIISAWNVATSNWIRKICYNRVPSPWATLFAFVLSAVWHGFYPGYYFGFISGAIMQIASVKMRKLLRHHFIKSKTWSYIYDIITWATSHICIDFGVTCIHLLSFEKCWQFWRFYYFFPIILISLAALVPIHGNKSKIEREE